MLLQFLLVFFCFPKLFIFFELLKQAMAATTNLPNITLAAAFEESLWTNGPVASDPFYNVPGGSARAAPGTLLKVEHDANASLYTLPPATAISRIMFQSQTLNGTPVPASAYVLWPYQPRHQPDGTLPVVAWAHGTSGLYGNCGPSHLKQLWQHFDAPFPLALQGYVTVAPDYAGLGVEKTSDGQYVVHQFIAYPAHANDLFYAVEAAQNAFPQLSSEFVLLGHSQGGGATWGAAERQAVKPVRGYLGSIAVSPVVNVLEVSSADILTIYLFGSLMSYSIQSVFPEFDPRTIFTDVGWQGFQMYSDARGCISVAAELLGGIEVLSEGWKNNSYVQKYVELTSSGGRKIAGPLLIFLGEADPNINFTATMNAIDTTVRAYPDSQVDSFTLPGITHTPALFASQHIWLDWIADRFAGVEVQAGYRQQRISDPPRPLSTYHSDANWYLTVANQAFELT